MQVVILAAGRGSRLGSLTRTRSKGMLPVLGTPVIGWALGTFLEAGIRSFVAVIRPEDRELGEYLLTWRPGNAEIAIAEQPTPLGMGDALRCAAPWLGSRFLVTACDSVFTPEAVQRFVSTWDQRQELAGLVGLEHAGAEDLTQRSVVLMEGRRILQVIEKPGPHEVISQVTSLPLYGFSRKILLALDQLDLSPRGELELQSAIQRLIDAGSGIEGVFIKRRWNLTTASDLLAMNLEALRNSDPAWDAVALEKKWGVKIQPPVRIDSGVVIGPDVALGPEVFLEGGCSLGEGVVLSRTVVLRQANIPPGRRVEGEIVG